MNNAKTIVKQILQNKNLIPKKNIGIAFAPINIALIKYWGKRDLNINLPMTDSLSLTLGSKGVWVVIQSIGPNDVKHGRLYGAAPTGELSDIQNHPAIQKFLKLFQFSGVKYDIAVTANIPIAAGLASSAAIFSGIVLALNDLYGWGLSDKDLSILARLGSGSACRSIYPGFVKWHKGFYENGMDSFAEPINTTWSELQVGLLIFSESKKAVSSREGMRITVETSSLYKRWSGKVAEDLIKVEKAIAEKDFHLLGKISEDNAVFMHETMLDAKPKIDYSSSETYLARKKIKDLRKKGVDVYFTQDAGPNLKLLFLKKDAHKVREIFSDIEIVTPFANPNITEVVLVDENDKEVGVCEKMEAHEKALLHRAFSIMIFHEDKVLLQKRALNKYHCPGLWANSCCSHPAPSEDVLAAAKRRLKEELGFVTDLYPVGKFIYKAEFANGLTEYELDHVLVGAYEFDFINFNQDEVSAYRWITLAELKMDMQKSPDNYVPWLFHVVNFFT
ncbi:MAG: diphosphomevalonate decarboxylase [Gammaproteobacteria bacterium]|nr:diphosphomevalonate decarboxylase [Gammaproteobacteria bacterium]